MQLYNHIKSVLEQNEDFYKDGKIFKNKVVEAALKLDPTILSLLLKDETAKKTFFQEVEGVLVFDKIKFQKFVSNKEFLPDSFTAFKNKIGLTANGEYLTEAKEVVLDFPFKDCVLEGGQTKEDQKRQEIFWNETLAPDEIDRLFEPKVLTNWKRFDKNGANEVKSISKDENFIIKGNNLIALHSLKSIYKGQIKLIYIDPPFNTGNDSFLYNDSFNHSTWLTFMKNRLEIAKVLLSDEGLIFINIDDIEEAYLKVLCDEIFGIENFVNVIAVKSSTPSGTKTAHKDKTIIKQKDLILVYRKSKKASFNPQYTVREKWDKHYSMFLEKDNDGKYVLRKLLEVLRENNIFDYPVSLDNLDITNKKFKKFYLENSDKICRLQSHKNKEVEKISRLQKDVIYQDIIANEVKGLYLNGQVITPLKQGINKVYHNQKFVDDLSMLLCDYWSDIDFQNTQNEGGVSFPTAKKPELLISRIIELSTKKGDIVLDYHLGSGTTAAVALKSGRRFIGIEQMDYGENDSIKRLRNVIDGDQSGVSKAYGWNGEGSFVTMSIKSILENQIELLLDNSNTVSYNELLSSILESHYLKYLIKGDLIKESSFEKLTESDKRKTLLELIDKNQFYVPYSEINDKNVEISQSDIALNNNFYSL